MSDLTRFLSCAKDADASAVHELLPLVYNELRKLASYKMAREAPGQTLQATALVHEAWLRLVGEAERTFQNRAHFFNAAGEAMRRILIERARRRQCIRHGGGQMRVDAAELELAAPESDERLLAVHEALDQLAAEDPQKAEVVKLRFFVGMSDREVAEALGLSERTVERYWAYSKAWLFRRLDGSGQAPPV
jgi:RNA polymerase sigma factor (TIGR02999 family)